MRRRKKCQFDYYAELGVAEDATNDEIKKAYRKLAVKFHPDTYIAPANLTGLNRIANAANALVKFKRATEAYETLNDIDLRQQYDNEDLYLVRKDDKPKSKQKQKVASPFVDFIKADGSSGKAPFTKYNK